MNATLRPGIATDALARASFAIEEQRDGYTIVRSPDRPDYWFGNCLVLDSEPSPASYEDWIQVHADAFAGVPVRRRVVLWGVALGLLALSVFIIGHAADLSVVL